MGHITCHVLDGTSSGIPSAHVVMDVHDNAYRTTTTYESYADQKGVIDHWSLFAQPNSAPRTVVAPTYARITVKYFPGPYLQALYPWISIQADFFEHGEQGHIIFELDASQSTILIRREHQSRMEWQRSPAHTSLMPHEEKRRSSSVTVVPAIPLPCHQHKVVAGSQSTGTESRRSGTP
jgi:hypothetical protein